MTAAAAPYRSELPVGRDGFISLLRAEWTKFKTVRSWVIALVVAVLMTVLLTWVGASDTHTAGCTGQSATTQACTTGHPYVPIGPGGEPVFDSFSFAHQALIGDGSLTVRVSSLTGLISSGGNAGIGPGGIVKADTHPGLAPWAKAGLIIKANTDQGSPYAAIMITGGRGVRMQYDYTHDVPGAPGSVSAPSPRWLRLSRHGAVITGYESTDGNHWSEIGTAHLAGLAATVQAGLFVTSPVYFAPGSNAGSPSQATATFDQINLRSVSAVTGWTAQIVGANADNYPILPAGTNWYQHSGSIITISGSGDIAPQVGGGIFGNNNGASLLIGTITGMLVLLVLATLFVTTEYRRGLIRTTLTANPRRGQVLAAKAIVLGSVIFATTLVATTIAQVVSRHVLADNGNYLFPISTLGLVRVVVGTALLMALAAVFALALGTALRRSAGAVVAGSVLLVLPFILGDALPPTASAWLLRIAPTAAFAVQTTQPRFAQVSNAYTAANGYYPLAPWAGLVVLAAYTVLALAAALWLLRHRDV